MAEPFGTVEAIYCRFGLPLTGAAADAIRSLASAARAGVDFAHRYALDEFGLTGEEVDERGSPPTPRPTGPLSTDDKRHRPFGMMHIPNGQWHCEPRLVALEHAPC